MTETGEFLCAEHEPPKRPTQWRVVCEGLSLKCDQCANQAKVFVYERTEEARQAVEC